jgi:D-serine deaminase-like pyridoxal phosphate-dependent protein
MSSYRIENESSIPSPALLIDLDAVDENLRRMIAIAGGPERLRTHVKTHKLPQLTQAQVALGITKFKCATIAEAEMTALAGGLDILLAMPPVGPNAGRFLELMRRYPSVTWLTIADDADALAQLAAAATAAGLTAEVLIDLDIGQHRTGIAPGSGAVALYRMLCETPGLAPGGLHAYDGHLHQTNLEERTAACHAAWAGVEQMIRLLADAGLPFPARLVAGGTPTFPIHAQRPGVECSPGTCVLWDAGYAKKLPDMEFRHAAWLLTRVISRPVPGEVCLDLGHKAVASEMSHPRVVFPDLPDANAIGHSEEHLVLKTARAGELPVGSVLYGIPWHVCPTVALHSECYPVHHHMAPGPWSVLARARRVGV